MLAALLLVLALAACTHAADAVCSGHVEKRVYGDIYYHGPGELSRAMALLYGAHRLEARDLLDGVVEANVTVGDAGGLIVAWRTVACVDLLRGSEDAQCLEESRALLPAEAVDLDSVVPSLLHETLMVNAAVALAAEDGDSVARWSAFADILKFVFQSEPGDVDGAALYAMALVGLASPLHRGFDARAGGRILAARAAVADLARVAPEHPGLAQIAVVAHLLANETSEARVLANEYARAAPQIARSHLAVAQSTYAVGNWAETSATAQLAYDMSVDVQQSDGRPMSDRLLDALPLAQYAQLQQGRYTVAKRHVTLLERLSLPFYRPSMELQALARLAAARQIVESSLWEPITDVGLETPLACTTDDTCREALVNNPLDSLPVLVAEANAAQAFVAALAAASGPDGAALLAAQERAVLIESTAPARFFANSTLRIVRLQIDALVELHVNQDRDAAVELLDQAASLEASASRPPMLPPFPLKPSLELYAETVDDASEALAAFDQVLAVHPLRSASLSGAGEAAMDAGELRLAETYFETLLAHSSSPDADETEQINRLVHLVRAREHLAKVSEDLAEAPQPTSTGSIVLYSMIGCIVLVAIGFGLASLRRNLQAKKRRERRAAARQEASYGNIEASGMGTEMGELNETGISSNQG